MTTPEATTSGMHRRIGDRLDRMAGPGRQTLDLVQRCADDAGVDVAWVGGGVRDLLLGREHPDLDLVVEVDPEPLARRLASALSGVVTLHARFGTASVAYAGGRLDLARARRERYPEPAALPLVEPAPLLEDLRRRDFTINALALRLLGDPRRSFELLDPCGGSADLERGALAVLHDRSFEDDPTRILRGIGFELRFGFTMPEPSRLRAEAAVRRGLLGRLSGARLWSGLRRALERPETVPAALDRLRELGAVDQLGPDRLDLETAARRAEEVGRAGIEGNRPSGVAAELFVVAIGLGLPRLARLALARRLALPALFRDRLVEAPERIATVSAALDGDPAPHRATELLEALGVVEVAAVAASGGARAALWVERWRRDLRERSLSIGAADLLAAGVPQGPQIGAGLRAARRACLDDRIGVDEELAVALRAAGGATR